MRCLRVSWRRWWRGHELSNENEGPGGHDELAVKFEIWVRKRIFGTGSKDGRNEL